jgi:hypothetical protein
MATRVVLSWLFSDINTYENYGAAYMQACGAYLNLSWHSLAIKRQQDPVEVRPPVPEDAPAAPYPA